MRTTSLSLAVTMICCTATINVNAQQGQGPGHGVGLNSTTRTNAGLSNRPSSSSAQGQGAIRSIGRGNSGGPAVGAQLGTGGSTSGSGPGTSVRTNQQTHAETTHGLSLQARGRAEMIARNRKDDSRNSTGGSKSKASQEQTSADRDDRGVGAPWKREGISRADWLLAKRLASIDHMRDESLQNGNERMLERADKLEALARLQYEHRTGEFAEDASTSQSSTQPSETSPTPTAK